VVGEINDGSATIPATPDGSQASSLMLSGGAGTSIQNTPQKSHALTLSSLPATSEPSLASSATPAKQTFPSSEPPETPQSVRSNAHDKDKALACTADAPGDSPTQTQGGVLVMRTRLWLPLHMPLVGLLQRHRKALQRRVAAVTMLQMLLIRPVQARMMHEQ